jgi:hypothetical protein
LFDIRRDRDLPGSTKRGSLVATAREYLDGLAQEARDAGSNAALAAAYEAPR